MKEPGIMKVANQFRTQNRRHMTLLLHDGYMLTGFAAHTKSHWWHTYMT